MCCSIFIEVSLHLGKQIYVHLHEGEAGDASYFPGTALFSTGLL